MEFTPETANAAAQLVAVLLVATMLDPWAKDSMRSGRTKGAWWRTSVAWLAYAAKVLAILVLLFDMQLVLFDLTWTGGSARALALGNYAAVVASGFTILMSVLTHIGAVGGGVRGDAEKGRFAPSGASDGATSESPDLIERDPTPAQGTTSSQETAARAPGSDPDTSP